MPRLLWMAIRDITISRKTSSKDLWGEELSILISALKLFREHFASLFAYIIQFMLSIAEHSSSSIIYRNVILLSNMTQKKIYDKKAINKRKVGYQGESASGDESSHPIRFCRCWRAFHRKESFVRQQYEIFPFMLSIVATFFSILDENNGDGISRMKTQLFPPRNLYFNE